MTDDIQNWLQNLALGKYGDVFVENAIDIDVLQDLADDDLKSMGVALGDRKRILRAITELANHNDATNKNENLENRDQRATSAERRQLTVMFCDLVGSTALSHQLDPEDLRDVMRRYQDAVVGAVTQYGGHVAKYLGDGVLAYFGWPQAYEDQAERAVRAGLDAIDAVRKVELSGDRTLDARVGIATGEVVVGDLVGDTGMDADAVTGETPNMAARLQQIAEPGQSVIGASTRDLLGQTFDLTDLGRHLLKGFDDEISAWAVIGESTSESRFEATRSGLTTPMVGRDAEQSRLSHLWRLTCEGQGQVVLVCGEAGIGKSRLSEAICNDVKTQNHFRIRYHCSPHHTTSPFYPAIQQLQRAAKFSAGDDDSEKLDKLERLIRRSDKDVTETWALFANLLSLPYQSRYGEFDMSPPQIKQATLEALFTELRLVSEIRPVLFLFEDAHWIDPTSMQLISMIVDGISNSKILFIVTHRPEWQFQEQGYDHVTSLALKRLGRDDNAVIARTIAGDKISAEAVEYIVSRTDGVPLFAEELTKTLVESGFELSEADVPATLQASLLARLDRLGREAKEIAQIGAVIGRDFNYDLLAEVAGGSTNDLDAKLDRLVGSKLVYRRGATPKVYFTFKHALVQDATYGSLLKSRRQEIHAEIAQTLEARFPERVQHQPELLAHHFTHAFMIERAIAYWRRAAATAVSRSANQEALGHFSEALILLSQQPETQERDRTELDIRVAQGVPAIATTGYSSPEVESIYLRARDLSANLGDKKRMFPVLRGLWNLYVDRANYSTALEYAESLVAQAEEEQDLERIALAYRALGFTCNPLAQHEDSRNAFLRAIEAMRQHGKPADLLQYGEDGGLASRQYLAWVELFLGYPERAVRITSETLATADALDHAVSWAFANGIATTVYCTRRDSDEVMRITEEQLEFTETHGLVFWKIHAMRSRGWALGHSNRATEGLELLQQVETQWAEIGASILKTVHQSFVAELCGLVGVPDLGLVAVYEGLRLVELYDERWYHAELLRIEGWLLQLSGRNDRALSCFDKACRLAQQQKNKWWLLRATNSHASLLMDIGDLDKARDLLAPVYNQFSEGFDTKDLTEAKALLDRLS
jgi:class 3 adenylate cyclase/tetratricopeptide (TPR) repeat protein